MTEDSGENKSSRRQVLLDELLGYRRAVFNICLGYCHRTADAEDLTQEVLIRAYEQLETLVKPEVAKSWLFRITRNLCVDHLRKPASKETETLDESGITILSPSPESAAENSEQLDSLKKAISGLPPKQREVVILREYGELSYEEIAVTLKLREGTVMSRLNRGRKSLIKTLRREFNVQK